MVKQPDNSAGCVQGRLSQCIAITKNSLCKSSSIANISNFKQHNVIVKQLGNLAGCVTGRLVNLIS